MGFKGWLLAENIIVKWFNDIATLVPAEGPKMDIIRLKEKDMLVFLIDPLILPLLKPILLNKMKVLILGL